MNGIVSRKDAKAAGLSRYFTGNPCPKGHVAERYVNAKTCCECDRERKAANPDKEIAYQVARYEARNDKDKDKARARNAAHYTENRDKALARMAAYYEANKDRIRAQQAAYRAAKKAAATNQ